MTDASRRNLLKVVGIAALAAPLTAGYASAAVADPMVAAYERWVELRAARNEVNDRLMEAENFLPRWAYMSLPRVDKTQVFFAKYQQFKACELLDLQDVAMRNSEIEQHAEQYDGIWCDRPDAAKRLGRAREHSAARLDWWKAEKQRIEDKRHSSGVTGLEGDVERLEHQMNLLEEMLRKGQSHTTAGLLAKLRYAVSLAEISLERDDALFDAVTSIRADAERLLARHGEAL
jgi:hypothetical protein